MKKALLKDSIKQIIKTNKRFISILLMAFLGVGFFAGVRASSPDMKATIDRYFDKQKVYDLQIVSTLGITKDDVTAISNVKGVKNAYGIFSKDVFLKIGETETVVKVFSYDNNINDVVLEEGRLPEKPDECVIEEYMSTSKGISIGDYIEIEEDLKDDEDSSFANTKLKVVGTTKSPLYISRDRGTTTLGSGKISYYIYINKDNITSDIFTEVDVLANNAYDYNTISNEYDECIESLEKNIDAIKEERQDIRYNELIDEATTKINDAQKEFDDKKAEGEQKISDAEKEIADGKEKIKKNEKKIADAEKELKDGRTTASNEFATAEAKIGDAENQIILSQTEINDGNAYLAAKKNEANESIEKVKSGIKEIDSKLDELGKNKKSAEFVLKSIADINSKLSVENSNLAKYKEDLKNATDENIINELNKKIQETEGTIKNLEAEKQKLEVFGITEDTLNEINSGIAECNSKKQELQGTIDYINSEIKVYEDKLVDGQNKIAMAWEELNNSKAQLAQSKVDTEKKFADAEKEIADGKKELADGKKEIADGEQELLENKEKFNTEIADAEAKLIDAREKINDIETAKWYIFDRNDNTGFNSFSQDTDNIEKLGEVFPIVFFIIATLISLTTMSRMVEEERVQIGTLKALGYNKTQIMSKYIIYSLLASLIGGIIGAIFGLKFFPSVIISMYQMMYDIPEIIIEFNTYYTIMGVGIMTLCIVGATIYTASRELVSSPAELMRPKSPKAGKRVLLERIPFIWKRLTFTQKVTLRNMFRYKKRFLMTVIGICGCTALIVAGFGLKDSISKIMDYQYADIYNYDMLIGLKNTLTDEELNSLISDLEKKDEIENCAKVYMQSDEIVNNGLEEETQVLVVKDSESLKNVIKLRNLEDESEIKLNDDEVVITDKLAQLINVKIGDEVILRDSDENEYKVKIGGITEHYISHYVYMTNNLYKKVFNEEVSPNILLTKYTEKMPEEKEDKLSEELLLNSKISSVTLTSYLMRTMDDTLSAMNFVVYVLIISAGLLAFIVLYNLANVNISERIRELATIKVLGFYDKEVYDYITREIILLTIIGIILGLVFGYFLNYFILGTCEISILRFKKIIMPQSYVFAAVITIIFTYIVNFITYFSLKKIDMIESLKSVE